MAAVDSSLASQCMDFCHALASQFSLTFAFSLDTKESLLTAAEAVKRKSPSAIRRNARRRAEFLKKRSEAPSSSIGSKVAADIIDVTLATKDDLQASAHQIVLNSSVTPPSNNCFFYKHTIVINFDTFHLHTITTSHTNILTTSHTNIQLLTTLCPWLEGCQHQAAQSHLISLWSISSFP